MKSFLSSGPQCAAQDHGDPDGCAYRIAWSINPHMRVGSADTARALRQHASFVCTLRQCGAQVEVIPFVHGAFDSVFTKDCALLVEDERGRRALLATPRHAERRAETDARRRDLVSLGFQPWPALSTPLEGGDVVMLPGAALMGHGFRTHLASARGLGRFLGCEVVPLELRDPLLYHLDTALTVLDDGTLLLAEEAFAPAALRALSELPFSAVHVVPRRDAIALALNVVEVADEIVTGTRSLTMDRLWASLGKRVVHTPLDEFQRAGGSAACLVARVHAPQPRVADSTTTAILSISA